MTTPNITGREFELKCRDILREYYVEINPLWPYYRHFEVSVPPYRVDAVDQYNVYEFKYQQTPGSVQNKLVHSLFMLEYCAKKLDKNPVLIYGGDILEDFISKDPAFRKASTICSNVQILPYRTFHAFLTSGININDGKEDRLLEHA